MNQCPTQPGETIERKSDLITIPVRWAYSMMQNIKNIAAKLTAYWIVTHSPDMPAPSGSMKNWDEYYIYRRELTKCPPKSGIIRDYDILLSSFENNTQIPLSSLTNDTVSIELTTLVHMNWYRIVYHTPIDGYKPLISLEQRVR